MNKIDRIIFGLISNKLKFPNITNPCDTKAIFQFYNKFKETIPGVRHYLEELVCYDIPDWRKHEIINELKEQLRGETKNERPLSTSRKPKRSKDQE